MFPCEGDRWLCSAVLRGTSTRRKYSVGIALTSDSMREKKKLIFKIKSCCVVWNLDGIYKRWMDVTALGFLVNFEVTFTFPRTHKHTDKYKFMVQFPK